MRFPKAPALVALLLASAAIGCGGTDQINWHGGAPRERTWKEFPPMNTAHSMAASVAVGNAIYVISGGSCAGAGGGVEWFQPGNSNAQPMNTPPAVARAAASAQNLDGRVFFIGGCTGNAASSEVDSFDFFAQVWSPATPMNVARYGFASGVLDGKIYVAGNVDPGETTLTSFEVLVPNDLTHAGSGFWNGECTGPGSCGGGGCVTGCSGSNHKGCGCSLESDGAASVGGPLLMALAGAAWLAMRRRRIAA